MLLAGHLPLFPGGVRVADADESNEGGVNYYNENDPKAAAWIRELIKAKLIPDGEVDERSITEVRADDVRGFTQCHFFAGIAGWSYALKLAGWPETEQVWTGSCPCQPFSCAGKGQVDSDERHLWPTFRGLIAECRPATVFGEQVASKDGRIWLAGVRSDVENLGYRLGAADLCAASVGAPHIRQRLFWVAESRRASEGRVHRPREGACPCNGETNGFTASIAGEPSGSGATDRMAHANGERRTRESVLLRPEEGRTGETEVPETSGCGTAHTVAHTESGGLGTNGSAPRPTGHAAQRDAVGAVADSTNGARDGAELWHNSGTHGGIACVVDDADHQGPQGRRLRSGEESRQRTPWETGFEVVHCTDGKARRFKSSIFPLVDGFPGRVGLLRGAGNAIVPQVAAEFIGAFLDLRSEAH